jgi:hypothetical protein
MERRPVTNDDVLYAYRLRVLASARELGSVAAACRVLGVHRSTFDRRQATARRDHTHNGRLTKGRTPVEMLGAAKAFR